MLFKLNTKVEKITKNENGVILEVIDKENKKNNIEADVVLISVGRRPYTTGLKLENVGVKTDEKGKVKVDKNFETNIKNWNFLNEEKLNLPQEKLEQLIDFVFDAPYTFLIISLGQPTKNNRSGIRYFKKHLCLKKINKQKIPLMVNLIKTIQSNKKLKIKV